MIIGNSNNNPMNENTNFNNKMNEIKKNSELNTFKNQFVQDINSTQHSDPTSRTDMHNKSLAMLQDRLEKGIISVEEFNKKVSNLNKNK